MVGTACLLCGNCTWYNEWRMEDCEDDGHSHHKGYTVRRRSCGNGGCTHIVHYRSVEDSCEHHAYHHWSDNGRGRYEEIISSKMGCNDQSHLGMDSHDTCERSSFRISILRGEISFPLILLIEKKA